MLVITAMAKKGVGERGGDYQGGLQCMLSRTGLEGPARLVVV